MSTVFPINMSILRERPEVYKEIFKKRYLDASLVDKALNLDSKWREMQKQLERLRFEINSLSRIYGFIKVRGVQDINVLLRKRRFKEVWDKYRLEERIREEGLNVIEEIVSKINVDIKRLEYETKNIKNRLIALLYKFPNFLDSRVPIGPDETYNVAVRYWGIPKVWSNYLNKFLEENKGLEKYDVIEYQPKHHYDLIRIFDLADTDIAGKISGARFFVEKNELVFLDFALSLYALEFYSKKGFNNIIIPPYLMRKSIEEKITYYEAFRDAIYHVVEGNLILITTSEHPIAAMYIDHTFREDELPLRILAWSPAFRKEAGAHGKDTKGIFRTHQFHKVELHSITRLGEDIGELEYILKITEEFMQSLNIPYRVTLLSSGDMDRRATIQYDIEGWFPGQGRYRELFSLATMGDWVSRKINTRVQRKNGKEYVANLYATGVAIQRMLCCIIENYYNMDSNLILVPEKLIKYTGFKKIEVKNNFSFY